MASSCLQWHFEGKEYLFMDNNAPVQRAHTVENYKDQNEVYNLNGMAITITRFKYNRKYLALHEERATKVRGIYRYQKMIFCLKSRGMTF